MRAKIILLLVFFWVVAFHAIAQDAVPMEILSRTFFIKSGAETGTAFSIDYEGKLYLITAKHVVSGVPPTNATIQIWQEGTWKDYPTVKTIYPKSADVDIAIFETKESVPQPFGITVSTMHGVTFGQRLWFLGYPYGISSHFTNGKAIPFIKGGTMSAIDATNPDAVILYIDGFNNPGFSGGPIVFWSFEEHAYRIIGVVQGYKTDSAKVLINGQPYDTQYLVNTGILVGYSIDHAIDAIKASESQPAK